MKIMIINGPNLNMLGIREVSIYGNRTYQDLVSYINEKASSLDIEAIINQSNHEGEIVDMIQECYFKKFDGIIINPAAYTHTSVAILDALKSVNLPVIEVHLSNIDKREAFRKISYVSLIANNRCYGKGFESYFDALKILKDIING